MNTPPFVIGVVMVLSCCACSVRLPYVAPANEWDAPKVRWVSNSPDYGTLNLCDPRTGNVLARVGSVFNDAHIRRSWRPEGDHLRTFRSPSNLTIVAHESATDASPEEHLVVFKKDLQTAAWSARSVFPPSRRQPMSHGYQPYDDYGVTRGVDDAHLYYQFRDGVLRFIPLSKLQPRQVP